MIFDLDSPSKYWVNGQVMSVKPYTKGKKGGWFIADDTAEVSMWYWTLVSLGYPVRLDKPVYTRSKKYVAIVLEVAEQEDAQRTLNALLNMKKVLH